MENDDLIIPYLTIEEMRELAQQEKYQKEWKRLEELCIYNPSFKDEKTGLTYCDKWYYTARLTTLHKHLLVEEYMAADFDDVDWEFVTNRYDLMALAELVIIYQHPLCWEVCFSEPFNIVCEGRFAKPVSCYEEFDSRIYDSWKWFTKIIQKAVLYFVDKQPIYINDDLSNGIKSGMHPWRYLMLRMEDLENYINFEYDNFRSFNNGLLYFDPDALLKNIRYIKEQRGAAKAAEIVKLFQSEWEDIELLDTYHYSKYPSQQITKFKRLLFKGFNKELGITEPDKEQTGSTVNITVNGDYVAGDKIMGNKEND